MSGIVGQNLGRGSGLVKAGAIDDDSVTLAKMAGLARGKLIYGDASGDPAALAVGGADEVLTHDGTDFDWAAAGGGGKIKQIVYETAIGEQTMTSIDSTWNVITNPSPTITPTATDNKILIEFYLSNHMEQDAYRTVGYDFQRAISGGATTTRLAYEANNASGNGVGYQSNHISGGTTWFNCYGNRPYVWVDTTYNTNSAITYSGMASPYSASAGNFWFMNSAWTTIMVLTEYE